MIRTICPKCGKETKIFIEKFCLDCFRKDFENRIKLPKFISIYKCKYCNRYSLSKKHLFNSYEEALSHFSLHYDIFKKINLDKNFEIFENKISIIFLKNNIIISKKEIEVREKTFVCKFCAMKNSGYKQAIIQLRFEVNEELLKKIENIVERRNKTDFLSFISKIERRKEGIDLYIGSKSTAYEILNFISKEFPIEYKISKTLVGIKEGKKVYLDTILIRKI
ncbi:MAG: NMD3-related protein [Candidatus Aenigmatarchaeota archaeon]